MIDISEKGLVPGGSKMKSLFGIINLITNEKVLKELTYRRSLASVPIGGRYRIIDFVLSNMVNSGIRNVGILTNNNCGSLLNHLGNGEEWGLNRKQGGLYIVPPDSFQDVLNPDKWSIKNLKKYINFIKLYANKHILLSGCNMICNLNYEDVFKYHQEMNADITVIYKECSESARSFISSCYSLEIRTGGRIVDIKFYPDQPAGNKISMEMFIITKSLLLDFIDGITGEQDNLFIDGFNPNNKELRIYGYPYDGYLAQINSVKNYYHHNMDLLKPRVWRELFQSRAIYTKVKDGAATKYTGDAFVRNSLIANDCVIGGRVENSIIFEGVRIGKGARVTNSIVLEGSVIEDNAVVRDVILDKGVYVTAGGLLETRNGSPNIIGRRTVI
jgi:glucose-1-phosphate adenylyltransferase